MRTVNLHGRTQTSRESKRQPSVEVVSASLVQVLIDASEFPDDSERGQ